MNVHRWRKLEGSDPEMYDLISQLQHLQKKLIAKAQTIMELEAAIGLKDEEIGRLEAKITVMGREADKVLEAEGVKQENDVKTRQVQVRQLHACCAVSVGV